MKKFTLISDYYCNCNKLYKKKEIEIKEGLTILVGCNGVGKTTLLKTIKSDNENNKVPTMLFDNLHDGGYNARSKAGFLGNFEFLAEAMQSSEGENIVMNIEQIAAKMGRFATINKGETELWFLIDAVDSGLSIDNIIDLKDFLKNVVMKMNSDKKVYIIVSANEYELANGEQCFDVYKGKYIKFANYEDYKNMIIESRKLKDVREDNAYKMRENKKNYKNKKMEDK